MDTNSVLLVAGICIVIGFLIGGIVSSLMKSQESGSPDDQGKTLLRVGHKPPNRHLFVELDGETFDRSTELTPGQRDQINQIFVKLNEWLAYSVPKKQVDIPRPAAGYTASASLEQPESPKPRLSLNPVNVLTNALKADVPLSKLPTESFVSQINDILQERLKNSPLRGEPIRLMEWPNKGMVVMVGLEHYESVDDVPNEEIRKMIRAAVSEWEQRDMLNQEGE